MAGVTGQPRFEPPPYAGVADLWHADDLPVPLLPPAAVPAPRPPTGPREVSEPASAVVTDREPLGHRVTRRFLTLCEHPRSRARTMRMLRSSADSAVGGRLLVAFLSRGVFGPLLRSRRIDHATARIELACAQLGGVAVLRYVTKMEPVASMGVDDLVAMVGPGVDATLTAAYRPTGEGTTAAGTDGAVESSGGSAATTEPRSRRGTGPGGVWARLLRRG
jgi:hypothetical protein